MKTQLSVVILIVVCVGLGIALVITLISKFVFYR